MDTLLPTQWIAQFAEQLHQRWRTVEPAQLEELAMEMWKDMRWRAMPPEEAAAVWLSPLKLQDELPEGGASTEIADLRQ